VKAERAFLLTRLAARAVARKSSSFDPVLSLAARVSGLRGWQARATALVAGAASVLAMAPFFAFPVLFVTLPVLVWLIDRSAAEPTPLRRALWAAQIGFCFGFGYFFCGLVWVGEAFFVEPEIFGPLAPLAVTLLPAGLALFYAAAAGASGLCWSRGGERVLTLALALAAAEWARGHLLTGFPWNVLGYALTYPLPLMQSAGLLGIYALSLLAVVIFALPGVLWREAAKARQRSGKLRALAVACLPIAAAALWGELRLAGGAAATWPGVKVRIVQPSVPQREKWRPQAQERIFFDHVALSTTGPAGAPAKLQGITHILWPEAAMPFLPLNSAGARAAIGELLPAGTLLISGALRAEPAPPRSVSERLLFNSLLVFGEGGSLLARYDKLHLVPFGEYLPLQSWAEALGLSQLARSRGGFSAGTPPRELLDIPGLPATAPLICYEAIFPGAVRANRSGKRPGLIINLTNDGWFGNSTGPRQHFHFARVRAVEEGVPLLRAANNGISAAIDGMGRVLGRLDLNERGAIDVAVPLPLPAPPYARFGELGFALLWLCGTLTVALRRSRRPSCAASAG
jgi:apolipoprotein N-acyltransferase